MILGSDDNLTGLAAYKFGAKTGYLGVSGSDAFAVCEAATKDNLLVESCVDAVYGKKPLADRYVKALERGKTTKTYEGWLQDNKDAAISWFETGKGIFDSFKQNQGSSTTSPTPTQQDRGNKAIVGVVIALAVIGIGAGAYYYVNKK